MKTWIITVSTAFFLIWSGDSNAIHTSPELDRIVPGPTPFISFLTLKISDPAALASIKFTVRPKAALPNPGDRGDLHERLSAKPRLL